MKKIPLRTDESRFSSLPDYPFAPHYLYVHHADYEALRLHYIDETCVDNIDHTNHPVNKQPVVLLLHGCPTWSYLYRHVITSLLQTTGAEQNPRIIAPDFIGCGKSDKLLERADYSYDFYVTSLKYFIEQLDLTNITLVCQDWGGPIGLRVFSEMPERFSRIVASNTLLPNCEPSPDGVDNWPGEIINNWVRYTKNASDISISQVIQGVTLEKLSADILAAYDAPFPDASYKQGMLNWPSLIPLKESDKGVIENRRAWALLEKIDIPFLTAFSDRDPSTLAWEKIFQQRVKGARQQQHYKIHQAAHMVQEDKGVELANVIRQFITAI